MAPLQCLPESVTTKKIIWPYNERYHGEKDEENRRTGQGEYYWSNAESLESYEGPFFRDTMHGWGTYRWRWLGADGYHITYEGYFFANKMHGYGTMSYPDGKTFSGLFCNDLRWGPGIVSHVDRRADVGLWRGNQLVRLAWHPSGASMVPDIACSPVGQRFLEKFRVLLFHSKKTIGDSYSALELLKQQGAPLLLSEELWKRVYSKYCSDMESVLCHKSEFLKSYYGKIVHSLEDTLPDQIGVRSGKSSINENNSSTDPERVEEYHYAWNNSAMTLHMMKHAFTHEPQRLAGAAVVDLALLLGEPRQRFATPGCHELNCRTVLLASFMGDKSAVLEMLQEHNVYPNVSDLLGNTAIMYATCGNQTEIIHHLVEAGAPIDTFNDSCFTPLGVALLIYALTRYDVPLSKYGDVLVAASSSVSDYPGAAVTDWLITRSHPALLALTSTHSHPKPTFGQPSMSMKKIKAQPSMRAFSSMLTKKRMQSKKALAQGTFGSATEVDTDDGTLYSMLLREYELRIDTMAQIIASPHYPKYLFELRNMIADVENLKAEQDLQLSDTNTTTVKGTSKSVVSKIEKSSQKIKPVREIAKLHNSDKDDGSIDSTDTKKVDSLNHIKMTVLHLLAEGANPSLVRCPQPALVTAIVAGSTEIVSHLIRFGADVNERYPQLYGYTPLQAAVSQPFSRETLAVIKTLLENGANANDRLQEPETSAADHASLREGPTLMHALIGRATTTYAEEELRKATMVLLLAHGCDAYAFYGRRSAIDHAMDQSLELLDIFVGHRAVALNRATSAGHRTILARLMSARCFRRLPANKRLQTLTNLVVFGADPLLPVKHENETYDNIFVYAQHELAELKKVDVARKLGKGKKSEIGMVAKRRSAEKASRSTISMVDEVDDYEQSVEIVAEAARQLHIRWIQSKLVKELILLIMSNRPGRPWHLIIKEHQNQTRATLWLTARRCLEIWSVLTQAGSPCASPRALRPLLAIAHYYSQRHHLSPKLVFKEKEAIDQYVHGLLSEPKAEVPGRWPWHPRYVTPELASRKAKKFRICFECSLPLPFDKIECEFCKLVSFCDRGCLGRNTRRLLCHPCSPQLIDKYFHRASVLDERVLHEVQEEASERASERVPRTFRRQKGRK